MLFYGAFTSGANFHSFDQMARHSVARLVLGGAAGPVAALFSACGMGIFYWTLRSGDVRLASTAAALMAAMILIGGSYHAVFAVFGFGAKLPQPTHEILIAQVAALRDTIGWPMYVAGISGSLIIYWIVLVRNTLFPRWLLLFLPTTLSLASSALHPLFLRLPSPIGGMIAGGWINGSFLLFFALATGAFWTASSPLGKHKG